MRVQFARALLLGKESSLLPQDSLPVKVLQNARGFFAFHPHHNPLGLDLNKDYLCEPSFTDSPSHWTGPLYRIHWLLIRAEGALAIIAFVSMLGITLFGRNPPFSRAHISIVLLWFISGVTLLLIKPWGGIFHQTFVFAPLILLLSMFLSWIPSLLTRWQRVLRIGTAGFCILLVLSSSILFLYATRKVAVTSCVRGSFGDVTTGVLIDLQERLLLEFGTVPTIHFFRSLWGPQISFSLIPLPEQAPSPASVSNLTFFFLKNADLPPGCVLSEFTYSREDGTLFGLSSPFPEVIKYSSKYQEGWHLNRFDDSIWPAHINDGMLAFYVGDNSCDDCGPVVDHGPLFLRLSLSVPSLTNASLLLLQHGHNHRVEQVYVNGALVYDKERPSTHAVGLLIDVTENLREGDNLLAVSLKELGEVQAQVPTDVTLGAFLMMRSFDPALNNSNYPAQCNT